MAPDTVILPLSLQFRSRSSNYRPANLHRTCLSRVPGHSQGSSVELTSLLLPHVFGVAFFTRDSVTDCTVLYRYVLSQLQTHPQILSDCGWNAPAPAFLSTSRFSCMCQTPLQVPLLRDRAHGHPSGPLSCRITQLQPRITCRSKLLNPPPPFRSFHRPLPSFFPILHHIMIGLGVLAPLRRRRHHQL